MPNLDGGLSCHPDCAYCDRLVREWNEASAKLSVCTSSSDRETLAVRVDVDNIMTLLPTVLSQPLDLFEPDLTQHNLEQHPRP